MNKTTTKEMWEDFKLNRYKNLFAFNAKYSYKKEFKTIGAYRKYLNESEIEIFRNAGTNEKEYHNNQLENK